MALVEIRKLTKQFRKGDETITPLSEVDLEIERGKALTLGLDRVVLEDRVGEQSPAHLVDARPGLGGVGCGHLDLDKFSDTEPADVAEPETGQRALHRRPLHVEDAGLQPDEHADLHEPTRPARRKIVSTLRTNQAGSKHALSSAGLRRSVTAGSAASSSSSGRRSFHARIA